MSKRYYFDDTCLDTVYPTLWNGMLNCDDCTIPISENYYQNSNRELDDLLADICEANFCINIYDNTIYISLCQDTRYYYYQFEKDIKNVIKSIEQKFNINIINGEFNATEVKHQGDQYKYTISKNDDGSISLKKRVLNWTNYEKKKSKKDDDMTDITNINMSKIITKIKKITIV